MVNIAADMRATSEGALNNAGSAKPPVMTNAPEKAEQAGEKDRPPARGDGDAGHAQQHQQAAQHERPGTPFEPARDREQHEGRRQLAEVERGERAADQVRPAGAR